MSNEKRDKGITNAINYRLLILIVTILAVAMITLTPFGMYGGLFLLHPARFTDPPDDNNLEELVSRITSVASEHDYTVSEGPRVDASESLLPEATYRILVGSEGVMINEYASPQAQLSAANRISPDGRTIRLPSMYSFFARKRQFVLNMQENIFWFGHGRFIVLYVGDDPAVTAILAEALGEPVAGDLPVPRPPSQDESAP